MRNALSSAFRPALPAGHCGAVRGELLIAARQIRPTRSALGYRSVLTEHRPGRGAAGSRRGCEGRSGGALLGAGMAAAREGSAPGMGCVPVAVGA